MYFPGLTIDFIGKGEFPMEVWAMLALEPQKENRMNEHYHEEVILEGIVPRQAREIERLKEESKRYSDLSLIFMFGNFLFIAVLMYKSYQFGF